MLKLNNTRPDEIIFNNNNVNGVLVNDENSSTGVWGKKFNLSITAAQGAGFRIERISSPYENDELRPLLSNQDSTVNYGDVLTLTATNIQQDYSFVNFEVNGAFYLSNPSNITCKTDLDLKLNMRKNTAETWHTVFTGTLESNHQTTSTATTSSKYVSGIRANVRTRVTGKLMKETNSTVSTFTNAELPKDVSYNGVTQTVLKPTQANYMRFKLQRPTPTTLYKPPYFVITKIEQFY